MSILRDLYCCFFFYNLFRGYTPIQKDEDLSLSSSSDEDDNGVFTIINIDEDYFPENSSTK